MSGPLGWLYEQVDASVVRRLEHALEALVPATPAAVRALAADIDDSDARRGHLAAAVQALQALQAQVAGMRDNPSDGDEDTLRRMALRARDESLDAALRDLRDRVRSVADALSGADQRVRDALSVDEEASALAATAAAVLERVADAMSQRAAPAAPAAGTGPTPEPQPVPQSAEDVCKVPGCDNPVKARGFCSRHYGQWYRGRLRHWVLADGLIVFDDGSRWRVDATLAGRPAEPGPDGPVIDGKTVEARSVR